MLHFKAPVPHEIVDIAYSALNRTQRLNSVANSLRDRALLLREPMLQPT